MKKKMKKEQLGEVASGTFGGIFLGSNCGITGIIILGIIGEPVFLQVDIK